MRLFPNKSLFAKIKIKFLCVISEMITTSCFLLAFIAGIRIYWLVRRISPCGGLNSQLWNASHTCTIQSHIASQINFIANLLCNKMLHYVGLWLIACSCNRLEGLCLWLQLLKDSLAVLCIGKVAFFSCWMWKHHVFSSPEELSISISVSNCQIQENVVSWASFFSLRRCCAISLHSLHMLAFMCY